MRTFEKQKSELIGTRAPRIQAKQDQIGVATFKNKESKKNSVVTFEKRKFKLIGSMDPSVTDRIV